MKCRLAVKHGLCDGRQNESFSKSVRKSCLRICRDHIRYASSSARWVFVKRQPNECSMAFPDPNYSIDGKQQERVRRCLQNEMATLAEFAPLRKECLVGMAFFVSFWCEEQHKRQSNGLPLRGFVLTVTLGMLVNDLLVSTISSLLGLACFLCIAFTPLVSMPYLFANMKIT